MNCFPVTVIPFAPDWSANETGIQKLLAIEDALRHMNYTERSGMLPEKIGSAGAFLDYFLGESKGGYCSYFATAFVLLARAEGIPARYVEGFCVPVTADKKMDVTSEMAHAWPEAYLEGIGWIPFEPTPGYEDIRYTPWRLKEEKDENPSWMYEEEEESEPVLPETEAEMEEGKEESAGETKGTFLEILLTVGALFLAGCLFLLVLERFLGKKRYQRMTLSEQFAVEVRRNLWLLSRLGFDRTAEETIAELQRRAFEGLEERFPLRFLTCYEEYRYGDYEITADILQLAIQERQELLLWIKQKRRWYYYLIVFRVTLQP